MTSGTTTPTAAPLSIAPAYLPAHFFRALDRSSYDDLLALLAPDCTWLRQGTLLEGKDAIHRALKERPGDFVVRHLISPAVVVKLTEDLLDIQVVMAAYAGSLGCGKLPLPLDPPKQVADYGFVAERREGEWRIREISGQPIFKS